jgi:ABC-2 type transport system ATP-binding protein
MTDVLTVTGASKRFGATQALDGADLALRKGEWLALLGPNGAGKTTLVRAVAGRVRLDDGEIVLLGRQLDRRAKDHAIRRALGIVPQDIAIYPALTARENLEAFGRLNGVPSSDLGRRVDQALEWTGLTDRSNDLTKRFSGGMKRRLNIACGVLHEPEVVLLDEPTVGVDPQSRQRIWEMLEELRNNGASLLLTTHQLDEAQEVSDRIVIIDHGKVIADGTFHELLTRTIGTQRRVIFHLHEQVPDALLERGFMSRDGLIIERSVDQVAADVPRLLTEIEQAGGRIDDMHVEAPTLQAVFIHLTGRELRE